MRHTLPPRSVNVDELDEIDELVRSALLASLAAEHANVGVMFDSEYNKLSLDGWSYFSIVSRPKSAKVRELARVRIRDGLIERRTYDEAGRPVWKPTA